MQAPITTVNEILDKQVFLLFSSATAAGMGNMFCAGLVGVVLLNNLPSVLLLVAVFLLSILRIYISRKYLSIDQQQLSSGVTEKTLHKYFWVTLLMGCSWGGVSLVGYASINGDLRSLVFLVNFALIAASVFTSSTWFPAFLAFLIPLVTGFFLALINIEGYGQYLAIALIAYTGFIIYTGAGINRAKKQELQLQLENKQLIQNMNFEIEQRKQVQKQLEKHEHQLKEKIEEGTKELTNINRNLKKEISERELAEKNLQHIAWHDELTNLPNKSLLLDRIQHAAIKCGRTDMQVAILFLDLDRFKNINDSLGHSIGDMLLQEVSLRLLHGLRKEDTIARNGGDEFVVVVEHVFDNKKVIKIAKKIISLLSKSFDIKSHKIHIGCSLGISLYPSDAKDPIDLLRDADTAMYNAKKAGGNRFHFYDENMSNQLRDRLHLENHLHTALEKREFYMVYQPQVDCETGKTIGFEALLRWNNAELGQISPVQFVPLLEDTGLIYSVGKWLIFEVAKFIESLENPHISIAVNLSALQCNSLDLIQYIRKVIDKTGVNPAQLKFEVTESLLINDFEQTKIFLDELKLIGCSIALDDFGTGYTSMSYLTQLPIDIIKIDRVFVKDIDKSKELESIVNAIVNMSNSLGIKNIFEGVETEEELSIIKDMSGRIIQGYFFSKPLEAESVNAWLASSRHLN
jgi:diguanylate cyclase (GGDEF)-like protein